MPELPRRDVLRLTALTTAIPAFQALFPTAAGAATPTTAERAAGTSAAGAVQGRRLPTPTPTPSSWIVKPFDNTRVTLAPSLFTENRDRVLRFLRAYPADRMLATSMRNFLAHKGRMALSAIAVLLSVAFVCGTL
ncbi:hypothetical protein ACWDE9_42065, partial [Streptomyces olivaceoviridis]